MPPDIQPLDWYRIFLGEQFQLIFLLEIAFRTVVMYGYAIFFSRFVGKRGVGGISPFELILIIIISSAAGDPMFYPKVPLLHGIVVLTVIIIVHRLVSLATDRSERVEDLLEGEPHLLIENGQIKSEALNSANLSPHELMSQLRLNGISDVGEVQRAYMEPSGRVSILQRPENERQQTQSTLPST